MKEPEWAKDQLRPQSFGLEDPMMPTCIGKGAVASIELEVAENQLLDTNPNGELKSDD
jgi:hypothetical protein